MSDLPGPVARAIDAANGRDTDAFLSCFMAGGVVDDRGRAFQGADAIRAWSDHEFIGVKVSLDVTCVEQRDGTTAVVAVCHEAGISPSIIELPTDEVEQALLTVASGAGMALFPESIAERYAAPGARYVPLEHPRPAFFTGVVTRRNDDHFPTASFLRALSRSVAPTPPVPASVRRLSAVAG